jgi:hypothetical protein
MALPLPSPIRDYAPVTWDTQRIAEVVTELNALNTTVGSHPGTDGHSGIYTPSAVQYYVESVNGSGAGTVQTISNNTITQLDLGAASTANGGGYNAGADTYTVPGGGIYVAHLHVRIADSAAAGNIGLSFHNNNTLGYYTGWNQHTAAGTGGVRNSFQYMRVASWSTSTVLRAYMYQDSGGSMDVTMIFFAVWRIG